MELVNISCKYISLLDYRRWKTEKTKDLCEKVLKRTFTILAGIRVLMENLA